MSGKKRKRSERPRKRIRGGKKLKQQTIMDVIDKQLGRPADQVEQLG